MELYEGDMMGKFSGYLICTDYDGTFATKGEPVEKNLDAVRYFTENGGYFTIASGRTPEFLAQKGVHKLLNAPAVLCNGSLIYDFGTEKILHKSFLPFGVASFLDAVMTMAPMITGVNLFYDGDGSGALYTDLALLREEHGDTAALKLLCRFETEELANAFRRFAEALPLLKDCCISKSWSLGVEINPGDATKGHGLNFIKSWLGDVHTTVGVGNYDNDISLLKLADIGAAPEGSLNTVLHCADMVLAPCDGGSIRDLIEKLETKV